MTPKRPNILRRTLSMLSSVIASHPTLLEESVRIAGDTYTATPKDQPQPKYQSKGKDVFISNNTGKIQTSGTGWQQRFYRVKIRAHKSTGLRRCDSEGNFINRKTGERLVA